MDGARLGPVFVGGTGRSGTGAVARLIAAHGAHELVPAEVRFHSDPGGLVDLVAGRVELDWFLDAMRDVWFAPTRPDGTAPGLRRVCPPDRLAAALAEFEARFRARPVEAGRDLVRALLDPLAGTAGGRWVEHSPPNVAAAGGLSQLFPEARFVHCVRDPADVACSVAEQSWGPNDRRDCLLWWRDRFRDAARGEDCADPERVLRVDLGRLVDADDRRAENDRLMAFLGLDTAAGVDPGSEISTDRARVGRWRADVPPDERPAFQSTARLVRASLDRAGIDPPASDAARSIRAPARERGAAVVHALRWTLADGRRWRWRPTRRWRVVQRLRGLRRR